MLSPRPLRAALAGLLLVATAALGFQCFLRPEPLRTIEIAAGPDLEFDLREAFITARPGDEIVLPAGTFDIQRGLTLNTSHVTLRGQGMNATVLDFGGVEGGAQGILATGDGFTVQDLAVEDTAGDGLKVTNADGVRFQRVRVEWTNGPDPQNGAYGIYPVQCTNVLVERSVVRGASDAGIYVGQSQNVIVRHNLVEQNVAGIEIENTIDADVSFNTARGNTGGILVFDLPGLSIYGDRARIFLNTIENNNEPNFAPPGNIVGLVPAGTGLMIMATDGVWAYANTITGHITSNVLIVSYEIAQLPWSDPDYDQYPERIDIRQNTMADGGTDPQGAGSLLATVFGLPVPDIVWDGTQNPDLVGSDGHLPLDQRLCLGDNPGSDFGSVITLPPSRDVTPHLCEHDRPTPIVLAPFPDRPPFEPEYTPAEVDALCSTPGPGVNWDALAVECPVLSDYRLFPGGDPRTGPDGGIPFDLTTPLFSDYATKYRFVFFPDGTSAVYDPTEPFDFPVGTVIAKTFAFRDDLTQAVSPETMIETRLLVRRPSGWKGWAYIWNDAQAEAFLAIGGGEADVSFIAPDGLPRQTTYEVPDVTQCTSCHGTDLGDEPLGTRAGLLNRDHDYPGGTENQLVHWTNAGVLTGAPAPASATRYPVWDDPLDGTLGERARTWLDINCAHCHSDGGRAQFTGLFLEVDRPDGEATGICKAPIAAGLGTGGLQFDIVPGSPDDSILVFRMESLVPAIRMPELSRSLVHVEGVQLVRDWITGLSGSCGTP